MGTHPSGMTVDINRTNSSTWSTGSNIGFSLGEELSAKFDEIGAAVSKAVQTEVSVSHAVETAVSVGKTFNFTVSPCDVISVYDAYLVVELKIDYIYLEDTLGGPLGGFTAKRGSETVTSTIYAGIHGLAASRWYALKAQSQANSNGMQNTP
jgi:hypothetical protein